MLSSLGDRIILRATAYQPLNSCAPGFQSVTGVAPVSNRWTVCPLLPGQNVPPPPCPPWAQPKGGRRL